jgi:hypothetical protein
MTDPTQTPGSPPGLPEELPQPASAREVAIVVLIPLLLLCVANLVIARLLEDHPQNRGYAIAATKWDLLAELRAPVDTLLLGDSSCNQGLSPEVVSKRLGGRALNLCTTGDWLAVGDAWMAQAYVERWGPPARIVVTHAYDVWARDDDALRKQAWILGANRGLILGRAPNLAWSIEERVLLWIGAYVPMYTQPSVTKAMLRDPRAALARGRYRVTPDGFMPVRRANPRRVANDARTHLRARARRPFQISEPNRSALAELVQLSRTHRIPLFVTHAPLYQGLWEDARVQTYHQQVSDAIERALAGVPTARLLSRTPQTFQATQLENADHVVGRAAATFTNRVCDELSPAAR